VRNQVFAVPHSEYPIRLERGGFTAGEVAGLTLIDRTAGFDPGTEESTGKPLPRDIVMLADPWAEPHGRGMFTKSNIAKAKVFPFTPLIYQPAMLELRRLIAVKELGDLAGLEFVVSPEFRAADLLYALAHLFGKPLGSKIGDREAAGGNFESFHWFAGFACAVRTSATVRAGSFELKAACRGGMIRAVAGDRFLRLFPAGGEPIHLPLPDGDGIYYNLLDVLDTLLSPSTGAAFPAEVTIGAIGWVQECIDERASLLL
jgi:hypothetical protein